LQLRLNSQLLYYEIGKFLIFQNLYKLCCDALINEVGYPILGYGYKNFGFK
jgi:hypothetical protein